MTQPPKIETERLILRAHRPSDLADCYAMWSDPAVTKYIGGKPSTQAQTWSRMLAYAGHWAFMGFGYWAIEDKQTGQFAGEIGFADFKRDIDPQMGNAPELGFALATAFHGRGLASEAVGAALAWGDDKWGRGRYVGLVSKENHPSVRVMEKAGFVPFKETELNDQAVLFFERILS